MSSSRGRPAPVPRALPQLGTGRRWRPAPAAADDAMPRTEGNMARQSPRQVAGSATRPRRPKHAPDGGQRRTVAVSVPAAAAADAPRPPPTPPPAMDMIEIEPYTELAAAAANPWSFCLCLIPGAVDAV